MNTNKKNLELALVFIIPFIAAILVMVSTRFNIGVSPDSTFYISAAQSITENGEIRSIYEGSQWAYLSHYPPGYPFILSSINFITNDFYEAARYSNALFILAFLFSVGLITRLHIQIVPVLLLQFILLTNIEFFKLYRMAWTEPSYIFFSLIGLYTLYLFISSKKLFWLIISGALISIAISIRYIGVTLIFTSVVYLWFALASTTIFERIKLIIIHGFLSSSFFLYWTLRNFILINNPTDRHFSFHPMTIDYYLDWLEFTTDFFLQLHSKILSNPIIPILILLVILFLAFLIFKKNVQSIKSLFLIYPGVYLLFLFLSNTFFDFTPLYYRTLSPIYIFIIISVIIHFLEKEHRQLNIKTLFMFLYLIASSFLYISNIKPINDGIGYSSSSVMIPSTIQGLNLIPDNSKIYTNAVDRLYFLDKRTSDWWLENQSSNSEKYYIVCFKNARNGERMLLKCSTESEDSLKFSNEVILNTEDVLIKSYEKKQH